MTRRESIPYLAIEREPYLEYDLTSLIYQLAHPEKPKLAVLSSLPMTNAPGKPGQPLTIYAQLQHDYAVTLLTPDFAGRPGGYQPAGDRPSWKMSGRISCARSKPFWCGAERP